MVAQRPLGRLLQVAIDGEGEVVAGHVGHLLEDAHAAADGVHLDLLAAAVAAELIVPRALEARLADEVTLAQVLRGAVGQLALAHLADVAEHVRRERSVRIVALRRDLEGDARQLELVGLQRDDVVPLDVSADDDALVRRPLRRRVDRLLDRLARRPEVMAQVPEDLATAARVLGDEHHVERWPVVDEDLAVAVVDDAARRGHADQPRAVVLGDRAHLRSAHDLEVPEPHADGGEGDDDGDRRRGGAQQQLGGDVAGVDLDLGIDVTRRRLASHPGVVPPRR